MTGQGKTSRGYMKQQSLGGTRLRDGDCTGASDLSETYFWEVLFCARWGQMGCSIEINSSVCNPIQCHEKVFAPIYHMSQPL